MIPLDWRSIHSMSEDIELEKLETWALVQSERLGRPMKCLEVGSYLGKTTAILAQFGQVLAVDLFSNVDDGMGSYHGIGQMHFKDYISNMVRLELAAKSVHTLVSTTDALELFPNLNADFLFIDGDHHYEPVKQDIVRCERHAAGHALMVFHDYKRPGWGYPPYDPNHPHHGPIDPWSGVARAVDELLAEGKWKIYEHFRGIVALERVV